MRRIASIALTVALGLGLAAPGFSQEKLVLTLDDCLRLALAGNPFVLATKEKEAAAAAQVRDAASRFFPSVNGQGSDILDKKVFTLEFPSFVPGEPPQRVEFDFTKTYQFTLAFSMPVFTGGRLVSGFKQANYNLKATREIIRQSQQETVFNVKKAFYGYLLARDFSAVAGEAVALAGKHAANVKNLYDAGLASKFDLLRSEVQVANLKPQLIRARNSLELAELALKNLLGLDLARPVEVRGELGVVPLGLDVEEAVVRALRQRPELSQLDFQRRMAAEMVKIARGSGLPSVAIGGAYNFWSNNFNFRNKNWESYYTISLNLNIPIFNGFASNAQVGQAKAVLRELELTGKGLVETIKLEVRQAVLNYGQAKESLASQERNVEEAAEAVRIAELNFGEGLATGLDVSTAQVALSQAKTNRSQALYDCVVSLAQLEKAFGENVDTEDAK
jgi:outer membrane protein TolC